MFFFKKIFPPAVKSSPSKEGWDLFLLGRKLYDYSVLNITLSDTRKYQKKIAALEFFDQAIEAGCCDSMVYSYRGSCLDDLGYKVEAIDDFSKALEKSPDVAQYYSRRAWIKDELYDHDGCLLDAKEAIRVSVIENDENEYWDGHAKKTGFRRLKEKYESDLTVLTRQAERFYNKYHGDQLAMQEIAIERRTLFKIREK